jgi:hypothetical protein
MRCQFMVISRPAPPPLTQIASTQRVATSFPSSVVGLHRRPALAQWQRSSHAKLSSRVVSTRKPCPKNAIGYSIFQYRAIDARPFQGVYPDRKRGSWSEGEVVTRHKHAGLDGKPITDGVGPIRLREGRFSPICRSRGETMGLGSLPFLPHPYTCHTCPHPGTWGLERTSTPCSSSFPSS